MNRAFIVYLACVVPLALVILSLFLRRAPDAHLARFRQAVSCERDSCRRLNLGGRRRICLPMFVLSKGGALCVSKWNSVRRRSGRCFLMTGPLHNEGQRNENQDQKTKNPKRILEGEDTRLQIHLR